MLHSALNIYFYLKIWNFSLKIDLVSKIHNLWVKIHIFWAHIHFVFKNWISALKMKFNFQNTWLKLIYFWVNTILFFQRVEYFQDSIFKIVGFLGVWCRLSYYKKKKI